MTHHDDEPLLPNLELSQDELGSIFKTIAATAITGGEVHDLRGEIPAKEGFHVPKKFQTELNPGVVHEVFYPDADDLIPQKGSHLLYGTPVKMEEHPDSPSIEHVEVKCVSGLVQSPDIRYEEVFNIRRVGDKYVGEVDANYYSQDGQRISPNNLERRDIVEALGMTEEEMYELVADHVIVMREMMLDDADKLRQLLDVVAS